VVTVDNAARNGVAAQVSAIRADVADYLNEANETFDVVAIRRHSFAAARI
jgi:23S rRNA G2069 N7-methylase RlmK/C1962 C5-methylase RlmI